MSDDERDQIELEMVRQLRERVTARMAGVPKAAAAAAVQAAFDRHTAGIKRRRARARRERRQEAAEFVSRVL